MYLEIDRKPADSIAVVEDTGKQYTYGELKEFCKEFHDWIPDRDLILILCRNTMAAIAYYVAAIENRVVPLLISSKMDAGLRNTLIGIYGPRYICLPEEMENVFSGNDYSRIAGKYGYVVLKTQYPGCEMAAELSMLLTTSGSTGSPKLVRHSYVNLEESARNVAGFFGFNSDDRSLIDLQLHYTMGLNVACSSLYAGAALMMTTHTAMEKEYWDFFDRSHITNITGVPYNYEMLKRLRFFTRENPDLRILAEGGGKLTDEMFVEIAEYAARTGKKFFATFGTSETTARIAYLPPHMALKKTGSIGMAVPNGELFLVDEKRNVIGKQEAEGELAYKGPNVTLGYALCREDLKKGDERKGIYYTGDLARRDEDGFYYILGRNSRFLKLYGYRVGLDECERLIQSKFGIECACAGTDEKMEIYIMEEKHSDEVRMYLARKLGIQVFSFEVHLIQEMPRNESGKIRYGELHDEIRHGV